jgi:Putative transposase of IS4/5 family (DUF4096)
MRRGEPRPWIVSDDLWERIERLLPHVQRRHRYPGRKRLPDRQVLCGILFVLYTAIPREFLPQELGFGSRMSAGGDWPSGRQLESGSAEPVADVVSNGQEL